VNPTGDQVTAFTANGGFTPTACGNLLLSLVFVVILLWGVWAMRSAYVGWAERDLSARQFLLVVVRFVALYLILSFLLLS
jgi:integrating conjugative element protein (TIGR03758 family)